MRKYDQGSAAAASGVVSVPGASGASCASCASPTGSRYRRASGAAGQNTRVLPPSTVATPPLSRSNQTA